MAELFTGKPLFPGASEIDQLDKICQVLGTPSVQEWPEGYRLCTASGIKMPQVRSEFLNSPLTPRKACADSGFLNSRLLPA